MTQPELIELFTSIPCHIGLGYRGQNGTPFFLKKPLNREDAEEAALIEELMIELMSLPVVRAKAMELEEKGSHIYCVSWFPKEGESSSIVQGFCFRDMNEMPE